MVEETPEPLMSKPVFYPEPPDRPRLQFLFSIAREQDLGRQQQERSALEKFVLGDEDPRRGRIEKPYGIAMFDGKIYVCDVGRQIVQVIDLRQGKFSYLTKDRRLRNPANIFIEADGTKYVSDAVAGAVFVFDKSDTLQAILGRELKIKPVGLAVRGMRCYVADAASNQVVVLDKTTGQEILRMGKRGEQDGEFRSISGLSLDDQGNVYVTDRLLGKVTKFDGNGIFLASVGKLSASFSSFIRPKGIAVDKQRRFWVVDSAMEVGKIFNEQGQLLLLFGMPGTAPGNMLLPAGIAIDYDNVDLFGDYFAEGAKIEFLVFVSNQFGPHLISVYGFGDFPEPAKTVQGGAGQEKAVEVDGAEPVQKQ
ncbi:MAG: 6-bladed beta-propeller [Planctomycetota bacterium]|jgi:streptogramin lyase